MSFFDEGDEPRTAIRSPQQPPPRRASRGRRPPTDDRTLLVRRGGAALVVVLVIVGVVFAVKAILDSQATQALRDYASRVSALAGEEQTAVRVPFFTQIDNAGNSPNQSTIADDVQQEVNQEQTYYHTAEQWSVPAQMVGAQRQFVQVLGLRYEALQQVAGAIAGALGTGDQAAAIKTIAGAMELFEASDVIYAARVRPLILQQLAAATLAGTPVDRSEFLPDVAWTIPQTAATRILGYVPSSLGGGPIVGSPGHALTAVTVSNGTATPAPLSSGLNRLTLGPAGITFNLQVANDGTATLHAVVTEIRFHSASVNTSCLTTTNRIPLTSPGGTYFSPIVVAPPASCTAFYGKPLTMTAEVRPVRGESDKANNYQRFLVEFSPAG